MIVVVVFMGVSAPRGCARGDHAWCKSWASSAIAGFLEIRRRKGDHFRHQAPLPRAGIPLIAIAKTLRPAARAQKRHPYWAK
jgi:hypothetical protein